MESIIVHVLFCGKKNSNNTFAQMHSPFTTCYVRRIMSTENSSERSWSTQHEFTECCVHVLWEFFDLAYREIQKIYIFFLPHSYFVRQFHQAHAQTPKSAWNVLMSRTTIWKWFKATRASVQMNAKRNADLENHTYTIELMEWHANKACVHVLDPQPRLLGTD